MNYQVYLIPLPKIIHILILAQLIYVRFYENVQKSISHQKVNVTLEQQKLV